jgi:hypothetical protein
MQAELKLSLTLDMEAIFEVWNGPELDPGHTLFLD